MDDIVVSVEAVEPACVLSNKPQLLSVSSRITSVARVERIILIFFHRSHQYSPEIDHHLKTMPSVEIVRSVPARQLTHCQPKNRTTASVGNFQMLL